MIANLASLITGPSELRSHASIDFVRRLAESTSVASEQTIASQRSVELTASAADAATTTSESTRVEFVVQCVQCYLRGVDLVDGALVAAAQLTQSSKLSAKRAGYLALRVFLAPPRAERDSELLVVASLQRDLTLRARPIEQCMALAAMDALQLDVNVAPAVVPLVRDLLLRSANVAVRTRATVSLSRLMARGVDIGEVAPLLAQLLGDPSPSVLGAALVWLLELLEADAPCPIRSATLCEALVGILRQCIDFCLPADLNAGGVAAPFVQIKLLRCIAALCRRAAMGQDVGGVAQSRSAAPVLSALLGALQSLPSSTAAALLIEVAQTVAVLPNNDELRRAVAETATPLLAAHSSVADQQPERQSAAFVGARRMHANTARAAALTTLRHVGADAFDKRLRQLVVECLETDDDTLQRLTLDLLSSVTNTNNVAHIAQRMSICARDATTLAAKLGLLRQTVRLIVEHAPTPQWHAQTLATMMLAHCGAERRAHGGAWLRASPHTRTSTRSACEFLADQLTLCVYSRANNDVWSAVAEQLLAHTGPLCQRALELAALVAANVHDNVAIVDRVFAEASSHQSLTTGASNAIVALAAAKRRESISSSRLANLLKRANKWPAVSSPRADDPRAVEWVVACGGATDQIISAPIVRPRWQFRDDEQAAPQMRYLQHSIATPSLSPRTPMTASRLKFVEPSPSMVASTTIARSPSTTAATSTSTSTIVEKPWSMTGWAREHQQSVEPSQSSQSATTTTSRDKLVRELFGND